MLKPSKRFLYLLSSCSQQLSPFRWQLSAVPRCMGRGDGGAFGMARLIDADLMAEDETAAFISTQVKITDMATRLVNEVVHKKIQMILADAPTGDIDHPTRSQFKRMAVQLGYEPVVHCKDCKHVMFSDCYGECGAARMGIVGPDDFCSYGERRTDE